MHEKLDYASLHARIAEYLFHLEIRLVVGLNIFDGNLNANIEVIDREWDKTAFDDADKNQMGIRDRNLGT